MTTIEAHKLSHGLEPNYTLGVDERRELFLDAIAPIYKNLPDDSTNVLLVEGNTDLANYVRSIEAEKLPTIPNLMGRYENLSRFLLVLQDKEHEVEHDRPAHAFRINYVGNDELPTTETGLPTFDDVIRLGLASEEELINYYEVNQLRELGKEYINVESNMAIEGVRASIRKPYSAVGYRALFELVEFFELRGVVAYQNPEAIKSLSHLAIRATPLLGNPNLSVPDDDRVECDGPEKRYFPLTIESTPNSRIPGPDPLHNRKVFTSVEYASAQSRIAGKIASIPLNIIDLR